MKQPFKQFLNNNLVLFDGAMGTYIYQRGVYIDKCYDALNLSHADLIESIHTEYVEAGAMVIETNTWGANKFKLAKHNIQDQLAAINKAGVELARKAAGDEVYVAGSVGPLGVRLKPWGDVLETEAFDAFREQCDALISAGADLIILETFHEIMELEQAVFAIRQIDKEIPVIACMTVQEDGKTIYDMSVEEVVIKLSRLGVDAIGFNCVVGPKPMLDFLERVVHCTELPIAVFPNAGRPQDVDGRTFFMSTADYFGVYARRFIDAGASIIGGCCGTTPEHTRKMAGSLAQKQTRVQRTFIKKEISLPREDLPKPIPMPEKSTLAKKITEGKYVSLVEMVPPRGKDLSKHIAGGEKLKAGGVDAINLPDGPRASARVNGMALAAVLQNQIDIEVVLHYACRDRNLLGMQSDLLGASILGIKNILAITGDPPMMGDYPEATAVFDIDAIGLAHLLDNLNHGIDIGNKPIGEPTGFFIGVGMDPNAVNLQKEIDRLHQKVDAGAEFIITQPVFDLDKLRSFQDQIKDITIPLIAGVWPLVSLRNAEFMKNEVPGVVVPDALITRIASFTQKEDQLKCGIDIAREMASEVKSISQGIQVSAPFGRYNLALEVLEAV